MKKGILRLLGLLLVAAGVLAVTGCGDGRAAPYFITGTINGTTYEKSGYLNTGVDAGWTILLAMDDALDIISFDGIWQIEFNGTTAGTYNFPNAVVILYVNAGTTYGSGDDIVVVVTEYSSDRIAGTFSGSFTYSEDGLEYPGTGEFRLQL